MNWEPINGNWSQIQSDLKSRWDKLTDDDLEGIAGKRAQLIDRLRVIYGLTSERAEAELRDWERHHEPIAPIGPTK